MHFPKCFREPRFHAVNRPYITLQTVYKYGDLMSPAGPVGQVPDMKRLTGQRRIPHVPWPGVVSAIISHKIEVCATPFPCHSTIQTG